MERLLLNALNSTAANLSLNISSLPDDGVALLQSPETPPDDDSSGSQGSLLGISVGLFVLACMCWLLKPRPVDMESSWLRRLAREQEPKESPEERQARIDAALTVQVVTATHADGSLRLGPEPTAELEEGLLEGCSSSHASVLSDEMGACCCICLEPYEIGDDVAWNKRQLERCQHVFHKECIIEWLERHNDCPSCRIPIVVDVAKETEEESEKPAAFAIVHGLLSRVVKTLKEVKNKQKSPKPEIFRRVTSLGTCQTWERLPSSDSGEDMSCTARAQMIRRVVSDGLSTPSSSRRNFLLEKEELFADLVDSKFEKGDTQILRRSDSSARDVLEDYEAFQDEDLTEEDEIIHKIL